MTSGGSLDKELNSPQHYRYSTTRDKQFVCKFYGPPGPHFGGFTFFLVYLTFIMAVFSKQCYVFINSSLFLPTSDTLIGEFCHLRLHYLITHTTVSQSRFYIQCLYIFKRRKHLHNPYLFLHGSIPPSLCSMSHTFLAFSTT
jgi:hypothetical protein